MVTYAVATKQAINFYRNSPLCRELCGNKPFGSRHWEYPWAIEQSGALNHDMLRVLDVAPDFTFPYAYFLEKKHEVTFIDLEKKAWSDSIIWGADVAQLSRQSDYRIMDVRALTFPDNTFDTIFCISVLEHIICPTQDPNHPGLRELCCPQGAQPALKEMFRCLKPGGRLVLTIDIYGGDQWKPCFDPWNIQDDIRMAGFDINDLQPLDRKALFESPDTFISQFHGPYITLGFCLEK